MQDYEVVAYGCDGQLYCPEHIAPTKEELEDGFVYPVFAGNEGWEDHCCFVCLSEAVERGEQPLTLGESQ
jgi:hypothetical protein